VVSAITSPARTGGKVCYQSGSGLVAVSITSPGQTGGKCRPITSPTRLISKSVTSPAVLRHGTESNNT